MKLCGGCGETKPRDLFSKNASKRDGLHCRCKSCDNARTRAWYAANRERDLQQGEKWRKENMAHVATAARRRRKSNPERYREHVRQYKKRNPLMIAAYEEATKPARREYRRKWYAKNLETKRAQNRQWAKNNPAKHAAICAARRAARLQATPAWADRKAIALIYVEARKVSADTGVLHHVDHFYPLRGRTVCGLHVEGNLRVLRAEENWRKSSRMVEALS